ncbi:DUF4292 domain-containing protein [Capnocytophaga canis]|uniref:DUF4292 domain-containing protein n=1 Tax=Capnocytophaga canis TaxID=1848903 RepID=UPI00370DC34C
MRKIVFLVALGLLTFACKSKKSTVSAGEVDRKMKVGTLIQHHSNAFPKFVTVNGSISLAHGSEGNMSSLPALSFRMQKDKAIWFSAPLGVAKVFVTPEKASYYNRLENTHFDGDFSHISDLLGFEVNFENLQRLLLGQYIYDQDTSNTKIILIDSQNYILQSENINTLKTIYGITPKTYRIGFLEITNTENPKEKSEVTYTYQKVDNVLFPDTIKINVRRMVDGELQKTEIELSFKSIRLNEKVNFPFKIPSGTKSIL